MLFLEYKMTNEHLKTQLLLNVYEKGFINDCHHAG